MIPDRGIGHDLQLAWSTAIPFCHDDRCPYGFWIFQDGFECWQASSFQPWPAPLSGSARRSRRKQAGVNPQSGDQADVTTKCLDQVKGGEAGVGDNNQATIWQPTLGLQNDLTRPINHLLCRRLCSSFQRLDGARTVRNGKAQRRFAQGMGTMTMRDSQRRPLALTKWPREERTGSR